MTGKSSVARYDRNTIRDLFGQAAMLGLMFISNIFCITSTRLIVSWIFNQQLILNHFLFESCRTSVRSTDVSLPKMSSHRDSDVVYLFIICAVSPRECDSSDTFRRFSGELTSRLWPMTSSSPCDRNCVYWRKKILSNWIIYSGNIFFFSDKNTHTISTVS